MNETQELECGYCATKFDATEEELNGIITCPRCEREVWVEESDEEHMKTCPLCSTPA